MFGQIRLPTGSVRQSGSGKKKKKKKNKIYGLHPGKDRRNTRFDVALRATMYVNIATFLGISLTIAFIFRLWSDRNH